MSVKLYRLMNGDELIAKMTREDTESIDVTDAVSIIYHPAQDGRMTAGFAPFLPYAGKGDIRIYKQALCAMGEVKEDMLSEYNRIFSNIVIAPASTLASM